MQLPADHSPAEPPADCRQQRAVLPVIGTSMMPLLRPGDRVEVDLRPATLWVGDLVVFRVAGESVVHRVVWMHHHPGAGEAELELVTQGDWTCRRDPPIGLRLVVGKVVAVRTSGRVIALDTRLATVLSRGIGLLSRLRSAGSLPPPGRGTRQRTRPAKLTVRWAVRLALAPSAGLALLLALVTRHLPGKRRCTPAPPGALACRVAGRIRVWDPEARR